MNGKRLGKKTIFMYLSLRKSNYWLGSSCMSRITKQPKISLKKLATLVFLLFLLVLSPAGFLRFYTSRANSVVQSLSVQYVASFLDDPDIVLNLPLLEGKGSVALDFSGLFNPALLSPFESVDWLSGGGIRFNGVNNSMVANLTSSLSGQERTVIVKFMWTGNTSSLEMYLYDDGWARNGSLIIYVHPETSRLYAEFKTVSGVQKNIWQPIVPNKVYTAVFTFNGSLYSLRLDDQEKSANLSTVEMLQTTDRITFGADFNLNRRFFFGNIYSVCIFNRSLDRTELSVALAALQGVRRLGPNGRCVIGGWVYQNVTTQTNLPISPVQVFLNKTVSTFSDGYGAFRFVVDAPPAVGKHTYFITVGDNIQDVTPVSVVVDRVVVCDAGSVRAVVGGEAVAWFRFASEFDGEFVESGSVSLSGGLSALWNSSSSRWECRLKCHEPANLTVRVASVVWDKYGLTVFSPLGSREVTLEWASPIELTPIESDEVVIRWFNDLMVWVKGLGPLFFGVIGVVVLLGALFRSGMLKLSAEISPELEELRSEIAHLVESSNLNESEAIILNQIYNKLLDGNPPPEVLNYISDCFNSFLQTGANVKTKKK